MSCVPGHENVVFLKDASAVRTAFLSLYALLLFWGPRKIVAVACPSGDCTQKTWRLQVCKQGISEAATWAGRGTSVRCFLTPAVGLAEGEQGSPTEPGLGGVVLVGPGVVSGSCLPVSPVKEPAPGAGPEKVGTPQMMGSGESHRGDQDAVGWRWGIIKMVLSRRWD